MVSHTLRMRRDARFKYGRRPVRHQTRRAPRTVLNNRVASRIRTAAVVQRTIKRSGSATSFSASYYKRRAGKYIKISERLTAPQIYAMNAAQENHGATFGVQDYFSLEAYNNVDMTAILNASAALSGAAGNFVKSVKTVLERCTSKYTFTNPSKASMFLDIYDVVCKRATASNDSDVSSVSFANGITDMGITPTTIGLMPSASDNFRNFWRITKSTSVELPAGASHEHKVASADNRAFDYINEVAQNATPGLTRGILVIYRGQTCADSAGALGTITTAVPCLQTLLQRQYQWSIAKQNYQTMNISNTLPTTLTTAGIIMDPVDGAVELITRA